MHSPPAEVICSRIHSVIQWASTGSWVLNQSIRSIHHLRISVGDEHWWICSHRLAFHLKNGACSCGLHILRSEHCTVCVWETDGKRRESSMCSFQSVCLYQSLFYLVRTRKGMIETMLTILFIQQWKQIPNHSLSLCFFDLLTETTWLFARSC